MNNSNVRATNPKVTHSSSRCIFVPFLVVRDEMEISGVVLRAGLSPYSHNICKLIRKDLRKVCWIVSSEEVAGYKVNKLRE